MRASRDITKPECGFWLVKLVRGGPDVPASIQRIHTRFEPGNPTNLMDRSPFLAAFVADAPVEIEEVWTRRGRPIPESEYRFRLADAAWARQHAPHEPIANPNARVDLSTMRPPF